MNDNRPIGVDREDITFLDDSTADSLYEAIVEFNIAAESWDDLPGFCKTNRDRVEKFIFLTVPRFEVPDEIEILKNNANYMRRVGLSHHTMASVVSRDAGGTPPLYT